MPARKVDIQFNADTMTVSDLKFCASALASILDDFDKFLMEHPDWGPEQATEFALRVLQVRDSYTTSRERR